MSRQEISPGDPHAPRPADAFERAKLPMLIAAVVMVAGLAISGSLDKTPARAGDPAPSVPFGGAVVLAAWVLGIGALHRLGRAGSMDRSENRSRPAPVEPPEKKRAEEDDEDDETDDSPSSKPD